MGYQPTQEQIAVLDAFRAGGNVTVKAYAGAGKTSTLVQAAELAPNRRGIFTAFNKKIIEDSSRKFGRNVRCQTTHALASHVARADDGWRWGRMKAPRIYGRQLALLLGVNDPINLGHGTMLHPSRLASLALMMVDRFATSGDDDLGWWHMPHVPGIEDRDTRKLIGEALVPAARRGWADVTNPKGRLRYTHNYYRKEYALTHPRIEADFIMVDEAQDSAGILVRLMQDQVQHGTQIITVGDSFQAINGWAGAVDAMDKFEGEQLLLSQSFRFGHAIAEEANKWLELLGATVPLRGFDKVQSYVGTLDRADAVLCRTNGAVVAEVIDRLTKGERVAMLGDPAEITNFTRGARDLMDKGWSGHHDLMAFGSWGQVQEYVNHDDAGADLKVMVDLIDQHGVDVIEDSMTRLATPARADVVLSTAHKCKGAEWGAVRIGTDFKAPKPDEVTKRRIVSKEAAMLNYVAITRAKLGLDRGSLSWVDEVLAEHREHTFRRPIAPAGTDTMTPAVAPTVPEGEVIAVVDVDALDAPKAGDRMGPAVVVATEQGLATVQPLNIDGLPGRTARTRTILVEAARTPIPLDGDPTPEWAKAGLPGHEWTEADLTTLHEVVAEEQAAALRVWAEGTEQEKAAKFGTPIPETVQRAVTAAAAGGVAVAEVILADPTPAEPAEVFEADVDPLIAETAPVAEKVKCGATHKTWMNTTCRLEPHGPEVLHQDIGIEWDDSKCSYVGRAPARV